MSDIYLHPPQGTDTAYSANSVPDPPTAAVKKVKKGEKGIRIIFPTQDGALIEAVNPDLVNDKYLGHHFSAMTKIQVRIRRPADEFKWRHRQKVTAA